MNADDRREARYSTNLPCTVCTAANICATGFIRNLSFSGLQLGGDRQFIEAIFPHFKRDNQFLPVRLRIEFTVPTSTRLQEKVVLQSLCVYCRRTGSETFQIGCQFSDIEQGSDALADYVQELMRRSNHTNLALLASSTSLHKLPDR